MIMIVGRNVVGVVIDVYIYVVFLCFLVDFVCDVCWLSVEFVGGD